MSHKSTALSNLGVYDEKKVRVAAVIDTDFGLLLVRNNTNPWKDDQRIAQLAELTRKKINSITDEESGIISNQSSERPRVKQIIDASKEALDLISRGTYSLPGGSLEKSEYDHVQSAIIREINEEMNLQVQELMYWRTFRGDEHGDERNHLCFVAKTSGDVFLDRSEISGIAFLNSSDFLPVRNLGQTEMSDQPLFYKRHIRMVSDYFLGSQKPHERSFFRNRGMKSTISIPEGYVLEWLAMEHRGAKFRDAFDYPLKHVSSEHRELWKFAISNNESWGTGSSLRIVREPHKANIQDLKAQLKRIWVERQVQNPRLSRPSLAKTTSDGLQENEQSPSSREGSKKASRL